MPGAIRPRSFRLMREAGSEVILRTASSSVKRCFSRTKRPSTRGNVPAPRGWSAPMPPSEATITHGWR